MEILWTFLLWCAWAALTGCALATLVFPFLLFLRGGLERFFRRLIVALDDDRRLKLALARRKALDEYYAARKEEEAEKEAIRSLLDGSKVHEIPIRRKSLAHKTEVRERKQKELFNL